MAFSFFYTNTRIREAETSFFARYSAFGRRFSGLGKLETDRYAEFSTFVRINL